MMGTWSGTGVASGRGADRPPEDRGLERDGVRLLVSTSEREETRTFRDLPMLLHPGDLLVVNESATLRASLPARAPWGDFLLNLSTHYGSGLWLSEPRWATDRPGPLPLEMGMVLDVGGISCEVVAPFPGIPRLVFLQADRDLDRAMERVGRPIRYGYAAREFPLEAYQTEFSRIPGSVEMPSAGRPFTAPLLDRLRGDGVEMARVLLHAGVSSLEYGDAGPTHAPVFPEPFEVPPATVDAIRRARARCGRVIAVGTTVVRALESAVHQGEVHPTRGFTRLYLGPERPVRTVDGLLTGFHDARSTHLAMLAAFVGPSRLRRAYAVAADQGYLWHEFGDSHLLFSSTAT